MQTLCRLASDHLRYSTYITSACIPRLNNLPGLLVGHFRHTTVALVQTVVIGGPGGAPQKVLEAFA